MVGYICNCISMCFKISPPYIHMLHSTLNSAAYNSELLYRWGSYGNSRFKASCLGEGAFYIEIFRGPGRAKPTVLQRKSCFYYHATSFSSVDCYSMAAILKLIFFLPNIFKMSILRKLIHKTEQKW